MQWLLRLISESKMWTFSLTNAQRHGDNAPWSLELILWLFYLLVQQVFSIKGLAFSVFTLWSLFQFRVIIPLHLSCGYITNRHNYRVFNWIHWASFRQEYEERVTNLKKKNGLKTFSTGSMVSVEPKGFWIVTSQRIGKRLKEFLVKFREWNGIFEFYKPLLFNSSRPLFWIWISNLVQIFLCLKKNERLIGRELI